MCARACGQLSTGEALIPLLRSNIACHSRRPKQLTTTTDSRFGASSSRPMSLDRHGGRILQPPCLSSTLGLDLGTPRVGTQCLAIRVADPHYQRVLGSGMLPVGSISEALAVWLLGLGVRVVR